MKMGVYNAGNVALYSYWSAFFVIGEAWLFVVPSSKQRTIPNPDDQRGNDRPMLRAEFFFQYYFVFI